LRLKRLIWTGVPLKRKARLYPQDLVGVGCIKQQCRGGPPVYHRLTQRKGLRSKPKFEHWFTQVACADLTFVESLKMCAAILRKCASLRINKI
jgi:hypothetical protein